MPPSPRDYLPLPAHDFQVLLALAEGPRHAYGLAHAEGETSDGIVRLELGSLYRVLARLTAAGLIESDGRDGAVGQEAKRRYYRLTTFGRRVAEAEAARLQAVVRLARRRRLASGKIRT